MRHRHQAVVGKDQQIPAPLEHGSFGNRAAELPDARQRPSSIARRVGASVDDNLAVGRYKDQIIVHAIARIDRPGVQIHKMPAEFGDGTEVKGLSCAADRTGREIPGFQRVLLNEPEPVLEKGHIVQRSRCDSCDCGS